MEKENIPKAKIENLETLNAYFKDKVKSTFWDIVIGTVSQKHLLRNRFFVALEKGNDHVAMIKLEKLSLLINRNVIDKNNQQKRSLLLDSLTYLFLRNVLNSNYSAAKNTLSALLKQIGRDDIQDISSFISRTQFVLQPSLSRKGTDIRAISELSKMILQLQKEISYAIINISLDLVVNDYNYDGAYKKIKLKFCERDDTWDSLMQTTEFLLDKKVSTPRTDPLINALLNAKQLLYAKKNILKNDIHEAKKAIDASLNDSLLKRIPGVFNVVNVLMQLLNLLENNNTIPDIKDLISSNTSVPDWIKWTALRLILISNGSSFANYDVVPDSLVTSTPFYLFMLCYADPIVLKNARKTIIKTNSFINSRIIFNVHGWNNDLTEYKIDLSISSGELQDKTDIFLHKELTPSLKGAFKIDLEVSLDLFKSRKNIIKGEFSEAKEKLSQLLQKIKNSSAIVQLWWEPVVTYWLSVAQAHEGNLIEAINGLQSLITGPKANEANGQLALCLIKKNDFKGAQEVLGKVTSQYPVTLYARALLSWRLNEEKHAEKLITEFISSYGKDQKNYYNACIRLLALIKETQGSFDDAIKLLLSLLNETSNQDRISAIRISRILVKQTYLNYKSSEFDVTNLNKKVKILSSVRALIPNKLREYKLKLLFDIMIDYAMNVNQLPSLKNLIPKEFAWYQLFLRELIKYKDYSIAISILKTTVNSNEIITLLPKYYIKTIYYVASWHLLINLWQGFVKDNDRLKSQYEEPIYKLLLSCRKENLPPAFEDWDSFEILKGFKQSLQDHFEESLAENEYLSMIHFALDIQQWILYSNNPDKEALSEIRLPESKTLKKLVLIKNILSLILNDSESKRETCLDEVISFPVENRLNNPNEQINIARLLAFWHKKKYKQFMELEEAIELNPNIPINPEHLWLAKAFIWFKDEEYELIFNGEMPQQIADLSNEDGCILMAKASARMAYKSWKDKKNQEALNHIKQAASTLQSLKQIEQTEET